MTYRPGPHRLALALLLATFVLLFAGGQVTSTESGDAVPTWPFPIELPLSIGGKLWELGHRDVAGLVGLLTTGLALWLYRARKSYPRGVARLGGAAFLLVVAQAGLGGIRVLVGAEDPNAGQIDESFALKAIAIVHACVAQAFFLLVITLCVMTARGSRLDRPRATSPLSRLAAWTTAIGFGQVVLGALLRHTMTGPALWAHVAGALLVTACAVTLAARCMEHPELRRPAQWIGAVLILQLVLGITSQVLVSGSLPRTPDVTARAIIPSLHLAGASVVLGLSHLLWLRSTKIVTTTGVAAQFEMRSALS